MSAEGQKISSQASKYLANQFEGDVVGSLTAGEAVEMALKQFDQTAADLAAHGVTPEKLAQDVLSGKFDFEVDLSRPRVVAERVAKHVEGAGGVDELKNLIGLK